MASNPPISTLRAFEAAARHRSFTHAADELCLTQSAISRHVRNLEEWFGMALFYRMHRSVALTPEGEMYSRELSEAFSRIDLATRRLQRSRSKDVLNVHAYATFAMRWLIPRLTHFHDQHPEIEVRLTASTRPVDFQHDDVHCAVRTGPEGWAPKARADKLYESHLVPVTSPELLRSEWPLRQPSDLRRATLLHSLARPDDWRIWLTAAGVSDIDPDSGMKFESSTMAYLAARQGLGAAIAQDFLVRDDLVQGKLVRPFALSARSDRTYYLLSSPRYIGTPAVEFFREWILDELRSDRAGGEDGPIPPGAPSLS